MSSHPPDDDHTVIPPAGGVDRARFTARPASSAGYSGNALPVGTQLYEFELQSVIGEGGFGIVYQAWDHTLERRVALKEYMPASLAARQGEQVEVRSTRHRQAFEAGLRSFLNEARLLAQFDHPALLKVYRFWEANGTAYMVMPLLQGTTLKDRLRKREQLPDQSWLLDLLNPLTAALQVLHDAHCYHRDIAADNVLLLDDSGAPLLLDFGAARRVIGDMTHALTVILKPGYAPVEQYAEEQHLRQGPWTDIYALGALLHWAIIGKVPPPSVSRLVHDEMVPLATAAAGRYSPRFLQAIDHALAVRPEHRTQNIAQLRAELGLDDVPTPLPTQFRLHGNTVPGTAHSPGGAAAPASASPDAAPFGHPIGAPETTPRGGSGSPAISRATQLLGGAALALLIGSVAAYLVISNSRSRAAPVPGSTAGMPTPAPTAPITPITPADATPRSTPLHFDVREEFDKVLGGRYPDFKVEATARSAKLRIGKDMPSFKVTSSRDGFVQVLTLGPDGSLMLLFPNAQASDNRIKAGQTLQLPQDSWALDTSEPAGPEHFLVIVSQQPRDYSELSRQREYIFLKLPTQQRGAELLSRWTRSTPLLLGSLKNCPSVDCDAYGAAQFNVEVIH